MLKAGEVHWLRGRVAAVNGDGTLELELPGETPEQSETGGPDGGPTWETVDGIRCLTPPGVRGGYAKGMQVWVAQVAEGWDPVEMYLVWGKVQSEDPHPDDDGTRTLLTSPGGQMVISLSDYEGERRIELGRKGLSEVPLTKGVARLDDPTVVDGTTDPAMLAWMTAVDAAIGAIAGKLNGGATPAPVVSAPGTVVPTAAPGSIVGKVSGASEAVFAEE